MLPEFLVHQRVGHPAGQHGGRRTEKILALGIILGPDGPDADDAQHVFPAGEGNGGKGLDPHLPAVVMGVARLLADVLGKYGFAGLGRLTAQTFPHGAPLLEIGPSHHLVGTDSLGHDLIAVQEKQDHDVAVHRALEQVQAGLHGLVQGQPPGGRLAEPVEQGQFLVLLADGPGEHCLLVDVHVRTHQQGGASVLVPFHDPAPGEHPLPLPVAVQEAELDVERLPLVHVGEDLILCPLPVVGMQQGVPRLDAVLEGIRLIAEHGEIAGGKGHFVLGDVPLPHTVVGGLHRHLEPPVGNLPALALPGEFKLPDKFLPGHLIQWLHDDHLL